VNARMPAVHAEIVADSASKSANDAGVDVAALHAMGSHSRNLAELVFAFKVLTFVNMIPLQSAAALVETLFLQNVGKTLENIFSSAVQLENSHSSSNVNKDPSILNMLRLAFREMLRRKYVISEIFLRFTVV
jgi:hypothetical protein